MQEAGRAKLLGGTVRATQRGTRAWKADPSQRAQQLEYLHLQIEVSIVAEAAKQADQNRQVARGRIRRLGAGGDRGRCTCVVQDNMPLAAAVPTHAVELRQALAHECDKFLVSCGAAQPGRNQLKKGFGVAQLLEVREVVQSLQRNEHGERVADDSTGKGKARLARDGQQGTNERASVTCQPGRTIGEGCNQADQQQRSVQQPMQRELGASAGRRFYCGFCCGGGLSIGRGLLVGRLCCCIAACAAVLLLALLLQDGPREEMRGQQWQQRRL